MKHLARLLLMSALMTACAALAQAQDTKPQDPQPREFVTAKPWPEYLPNSWKEFSPKEGRFKVLLPGAPVAELQPVDSSFGKLEWHEFTLQTFALYGVAYADFPEKDGIKDVKAFFDRVRDVALASTKAELLEEKDDNRFASPGRSVKLRLPNGFVYSTRLYLIGNRFYTVTVIMPEKGASADSLKFYEETAAKFLDSFTPEKPER